MSVPIYIINRDRVTTTRVLVEWLLKSGNDSITIIDNDSTYAPLLDYYKEIQHDVCIKYMHCNAGPWVFWEEGLYKEQTSVYVVTDSDVVPSEGCPLDLLTKMEELLDKYFVQNYWKVGPGLRIDNLPDSPWKEEVINGQQPYWQTKLTDNSFIAALDTTFAMYKGGFGDQEMGHALRLDIPYVFEHRPWYAWPLDEEEKYYIEHADTDKIWSGHSRYMLNKGLV